MGLDDCNGDDDDDDDDGGGGGGGGGGDWLPTLRDCPPSDVEPNSAPPEGIPPSKALCQRDGQ
eukprot:COSAG02_NODE_46978_length_344_cov_1.391837_2_plen_62_part_01